MEYQLKAFCLNIVPDTLVELVASAVEGVIQALPSGVHYTDGTCLQPCIVSGPCSHVAPWSVGCSHNLAHLPAKVFGSPDCDVDLGADDMAPMEHQLASWPSSSPHPSLDVTQAALRKCSVAHALLPQAPPLPKSMCLAPCTVGSTYSPVIMVPWMRIGARWP